MRNKMISTEPCVWLCVFSGAFVVKTPGRSHSAGEPREKTFSVQFRLFREEFGPALQKGAICLGLALFLLFEGDSPLSCSRWEVLSKTQVTCLTVLKHAPICFLLVESGNICYFKEVSNIVRRKPICDYDFSRKQIL